MDKHSTVTRDRFPAISLGYNYNYSCSQYKRRYTHVPRPSCLSRWSSYTRLTNCLVCMYVRIYINTYIHTHISMYICRYVHMYVCIYVYISVFSLKHQICKLHVENWKEDVEVATTPLIISTTPIIN